MKICFLWGSMNIGGAERVIASLSNTFCQKGDDVAILVSDNSDSKYSLDERIRFEKLNVAKETKTVIETLLGTCLKIKLLRKRFKEIKPDIIVAFHIKLAIMAKIAMPSIKVVGSERANPHKVRRGLRNRLLVLSASLLDGFIFQTKGAQNYYPKMIKKKSIVIPNAISIVVPDIIPPYSYRNKVICSVGRLEPVKRVDLQIKAFSYITNVYPEYTLEIYGDGSEKKHLLEMAKDLSVENRVKFMGVTNSVPSVLINSRIFLLSSDAEGMPNSLIEAMACGCVCVSTNCDYGPSDLIEDDVNGVLVETDNPEQLSEALVRILENESLGKRLSNEAKKVNNKLSLDVIANRYRDYFISVLENS